MRIYKKYVLPFYFFFLTKRDFFSFFAGIVVSGYVVELSLNPENYSWYYWGTILLGLFIGLFSYILINIGKNFEDNLESHKNNIDGIEKRNAEENSWETINKPNLSANKNFGILPKIWVPIVILCVPILTALAIICFSRGNQQIQKQEIAKTAMERQQIVTDIDLLLKNYRKEIKLLQDSLESITNSDATQEELIDSLENYPEKADK